MKLSLCNTNSTVLCKIQNHIITGPSPSVRYVKGQDDSNWITVDERTGKISVAKLMDRESLENSTYTVIVFAVDNGMVYYININYIINAYFGCFGLYYVHACD